MIQQDRFLNLLKVIHWWEDFGTKLHNWRASVHYQVEAGKLTPDQAYWADHAWYEKNSQTMPRELIAIVAKEQAHFAANAKRNAATRRYRASKKAVADHNAHKATAYRPWETLSAGQPMPEFIPIEQITPLTRERMQELQDAAAAMPPPEPSAHAKAVSEAKARMEELAKKHGIKIGPSGGKVFTDDEILGDTDGTEDPFA